MSEEPIRVLLIEDNPGDARLVRELVRESHGSAFSFTVAGTIRAGVDRLEQGDFDVALVDLSLPDSQGLATVEAIAATNPALPIVVNSGLADEATAVESLGRGAQDYLFKGRGDGHLIARALRYSIERKRTSERMSYLAHHDQLTGLANRLLFQEKLAGAMARARRNRTHVGLLYLDLDRFKEVNDVHGHGAGDQLLKEVARRLEKCVRDCDTVARLGGDEFTVVLEDLARPEDAAVVAEKLLSQMQTRVCIGQAEIRAATSIGIATFPAHGPTVDDLLRAADAALYDAKAEGRDRYRFFAEPADARASTRRAGDQSLRDALERNEFCLVYLPQVYARTLRATSMEALLRWRKPSGELVAPSQFMPALERSGLIVAVGEWVLKTATAACRDWRRNGLEDARVAVNISLRQLKQPSFVQTVKRACKAAGLPPDALDLEVTEELFVQSNRDCVERLAAVRALGVRVCVDDFGTGYVNLSQLADLPLDCLKVHQSFIQELGELHSRGVFDALVALGRGMRLSVVAEGVEADAQLAHVRSISDVLAQGYTISRPLEAEEVAAWWARSLRGSLT